MQKSTAERQPSFSYEELLAISRIKLIVDVQAVVAAQRATAAAIAAAS